MIDSESDAEDWLDRLSPEQNAALLESLAISAKQFDDGLGMEFDVEDFIARGRARRAARAKAAAE